MGELREEIPLLLETFPGLSDDWTYSAFLRITMGETSESHSHSFLESVDELLERHSIDVEWREVVVVLIKIGRCVYRQETLRQKTNFSARRSDLRNLKSRTELLSRSLKSLPISTLRLMNQSAMASSLLEVQYPRVIDTKIGDEERTQIIEIADSALGTKGYKLDELLTAVKALNQCARSGLKMARQGKRGRPEDHAMASIVHVAYLIWMCILEREFTLDWTKEGEPLSKAAAFCLDVARFADTSVAPTRVATAARHQRERKAMRLSDLGNIRRELENLSKRLE